MRTTLNHSVSIFCSVVAAVVVVFSISMIVVFSFSLPVGRGERCRGYCQTSWITTISPNLTVELYKKMTALILEFKALHVYSRHLPVADANALCPLWRICIWFRQDVGFQV